MAVKQLECWGREDGGKCSGKVERRRVLRMDGTLLTERHSGALCDAHYRKDLARVIRRARVAETLLSGMGYEVSPGGKLQRPATPVMVKRAATR